MAVPQKKIDDFLDTKFAYYRDTSSAGAAVMIAEALLAFAEHPGSGQPPVGRRAFAAFGYRLPDDAEGIARRYEQCMTWMRAYFAGSSAPEQQAFLGALFSRFFGAQRDLAKRRMADLLGVSVPEAAEVGEPNVKIVVRFPAILRISTPQTGGPDEETSLAAGQELARYDGLKSNAELHLEGTPALGDVPGICTADLHLEYDPGARKLEACLVLCLTEALDGAALHRLKEELLPEFAEGFGNGDFEWEDVVVPKSAGPGSLVDIDVEFHCVTRIDL